MEFTVPLKKPPVDEAVGVGFEDLPAGIPPLGDMMWSIDRNDAW